MTARGDGVGFLDPHGDLAEDLLDHIPPERIQDVCYVNPADLDYPIAWNLLAGIPTDQQPLVTERILAALRNIFGSSWGYQTEHILRNSIAALMAAENTSLLALPRLLIDDRYRARILSQVSDPQILSFWHGEYERWDPRFRREAIAPPQNKLGALFFSPYVRHILGTVRNKLDLRRLMDRRAIVIARLPKGLIGDDPATLLGALLMTQFQQAALQQADTPIDNRIPFHLFVDEFQSFLTDKPEAFATTLAEARKYKLFLTLSHQIMAQIHDAELRHAILGNAGNLLVFRVGAHDAALLAGEFFTLHLSGNSSPDALCRLLVQLNQGEVVAKLQKDGKMDIPFKGVVAPSMSNYHSHKEKIIVESRRHFTSHRHNVEVEISQFFASQ